MAKYETLADLINGIHRGDKITLMIDNDNVSACSPDDDDTASGINPVELFEMHPVDLLEQALDLLQIPYEYV